MRVTEMFTSIEGEGVFSGLITHFVRLFGCNLTCPGFSKTDADPYTGLSETSIQFNHGCDSAYSWHPTFKHKAVEKTGEQIMEELMQMEDKVRGGVISITGGEPLLWEQQLRTLLLNISSQNHRISELNILIETNGTKLPIDFSPYVCTMVNYSISPKLKTTSGEQNAIKPHIIKAFYEGNSPFFLKFVSDGSDECEAEIVDVLEQLKEACDWGDEPPMIFLMPMGCTKEQIHKVQSAVAQQCLKHGWNYSPRLHVDLFDNQMGT